MTEQMLESQNLPGDIRGSAHESTTINLCKIGDLNLVYRSVLNGWDVPQQTRDQICSQWDAAIDHYGDGIRAGGRAISRFIKLAHLMLLMDARDRIDAGYPKTAFPYLRKRYPEKRSPRYGRPNSHRVSVEEMLKKLSASNPAQAEKMRQLLGEPANPSTNNSPTADTNAATKKEVLS